MSRNNKLAHALAQPELPDHPTDLESKTLESNGQTGQRLVASTSLGHNGESRRRTSGILAGDFEAGNLCRLERSRCSDAGGGGEAPSLCSLGQALTLEGELAPPRDSWPRDHGVVGGYKSSIDVVVLVATSKSRKLQLNGSSNCCFPS